MCWGNSSSQPLSLPWHSGSFWPSPPVHTRHAGFATAPASLLWNPPSTQRLMPATRGTTNTVGSVPPPRCRWLCPRGSPMVQSGMKAGYNPSCKVRSSFSSSCHGWETRGEVRPLLQPQYRVGGVCLGQSMCPFLDLKSFSRLPGSLQPVSL